MKSGSDRQKNNSWKSRYNCWPRPCYFLFLHRRSPEQTSLLRCRLCGSHLYGCWSIGLWTATRTCKLLSKLGNSSTRSYIIVDWMISELWYKFYQTVGCGIDINGLCSHVIVTEFYAESINPANVFSATRCRDFNDIRSRNCVSSGAGRRLGGEPVNDGPSNPDSVFFLGTYAARPFAQGPR